MNPYINEQNGTQTSNVRATRVTEALETPVQFPAPYPYFTQARPQGVAFIHYGAIPRHSAHCVPPQPAMFHGQPEHGYHCSVVTCAHSQHDQYNRFTHECTTTACVPRPCSMLYQVPIRGSFPAANGMPIHNYPRSYSTLACSNSWPPIFHPNTVVSVPRGLCPLWILSCPPGISYFCARSLSQDTQQSDPHRKFRYGKTTLHKYRPPQDPTTSHSTPPNKVIEKKPTVPIYEPHWTKERINEGIEDGSLLSGSIRINQKCFEDSYLKHPQGDADIFIHGLINRNRALTDDVVAVQLDPKKNWRVFDLYAKDSESSDAPKTKQNKRNQYVKLVDYIANHRQNLEELIGARLTKMIMSDLDSPADPPDVYAGSNETTTPYAPWWTVIQRTARVVGIIHELHPRMCIGQLRLPKTKSNPKDNEQNGTGTAVDKPTASQTTTTTTNPKWSFANLVPSDNRSPYLIIPRSACPETFQRHPESLELVRFVAHIVDWPETSMLPKGELLRSLSMDSSKLLENETERILVNTGFLLGLDAVNQFPDPVNESAQAAVQAAASNLAEELVFRKDLRSQCLFTIDPSTARDLDDALHCRLLTDKERKVLASKGHPNAVYEVGVHIADVSYFVRPESAVDKEASKRATTIYLVQLCVPMLPRILCEELCSLNAGEDKLAFSVIFTVSKQGEILTTWFGRTVIRSCAKMSYEDAQYLIDHPEDGWTSDSIPKIEAPHTAKSVLESVLNLHEMAMQRRRRRFAGGSLRLEQVKSKFALDDDNRLPIGVSPYISMPSNWLVEEWMLAANEAVAVHLASHLPRTAFLRRHAPPSLKQLSDASSSLEAVGIKVNTESAGTIQSSICDAAGCPVDTGYHYSVHLASLCAKMSRDFDAPDLEVTEQLEALELGDTDSRSHEHQKAELEREARLLVAISILTKTMNLAEYFCLGVLPKAATPEHYALNIQLYTHFTSPIRRYADIIVHRQLAEILSRSALDSGNERLASWYAETALPSKVSPKALQIQAEVCNSKKLSARLAGEDSALVFFTLFVMESGPLTEVCAVTGVLDRSFDVLILSCGLVRRVYLNNLNLRTFKSVSVRRVAGRVSTGATLCLLWNAENGSDLTKLSEDADSSEATLPPCDCYYTEIKLLDVVRCRVGIEPPEQSSGDSAENGASCSSYDGLPKLRVTLLRPTCAKCQMDS